MQVSPKLGRTAIRHDAWVTARTRGVSNALQTVDVALRRTMSQAVTVVEALISRLPTTGTFSSTDSELWTVSYELYRFLFF